MNVLITGATGFIGTALCKEMMENGHNITAVIRPNSEKKDKIPIGINIIELSIDKFNELQGSYDLFYHLAWNGSSGADRNDFDIQNSNIKYTAEAIKAAKRCGCKKFIGAGSQAEYGVVRGVCTEETTTNPFMMYGAAKLASYHMGKVLAEQLGITFVWPRIYSVYGEGENPGTLMSYLIETLLNGGTPELSSCDNMWDFLYITDCAYALRLLGEKALSNDGRCVYNVSYGAPQRLKTFVENVRDIINPFTSLKFGAKVSNPSRTFCLEPDITNLKDDTGFMPKVDFKCGVRMMLRWVKDRE